MPAILRRRERVTLGQPALLAAARATSAVVRSTPVANAVRAVASFADTSTIRAAPLRIDVGQTRAPGSRHRSRSQRRLLGPAADADPGPGCSTTARATALLTFSSNTLGTM